VGGYGNDKVGCAGRQSGVALLALSPVTHALFPVTLAKAGAHKKTWVPASSARKTKGGVRERQKECAGKTKGGAGIHI